MILSLVVIFLGLLVLCLYSTRASAVTGAVAMKCSLHKGLLYVSCISPAAAMQAMRN